jgi:hypothetical protein
MTFTICVGGRYFNSPMRHRSSNTENLRQFLEKQGKNISLDGDEADIYLAIDHTENDEKLLKKRRELNKFSILYRSEPLCVLPVAYKPETSTLYSSIISFGKSETMNDGMHWPQYFPAEEQLGWGIHDRLPRAALINANKLNLSSSELYSLRRESVKKIEGIDLFGENWNSNFKDRIKVLVIEVMKDPIRHLVATPSHSRYWFTNWPETASPADKISIMQRYKFALVIENELSYMSEKLFDAFFAGCIPIYVGPEVADYKVPKELVIQCKPTLKSLAEGFEIAMQTNFENYQEKLKDWLQSESMKESHEGLRVTNRAIERTLNEYLQFTKVNQL